MIDHLSEERQQVIRLFLEGLEFEEIAEHLDKTVGACRQAFKRGIVAMRKTAKEKV